MGNSAGCPAERLPVDTAFRLPTPPPIWPPGDGFGKGRIDLGGVEVCRISTFAKVWAARDGGPGGRGATFFKPCPVPAGFSLLGCYAQPNRSALFGWALCGRALEAGALRRPLRYTLAWSSAGLNIRKDGDGYFWVPVAPKGYRAVGLLVTQSPEQPSPEQIRCVREDFADAGEREAWVWGDGNGFNVYGVRPAVRGCEAVGVRVGTCVAVSPTATGPPSFWCLRNKAPLAASMPNRTQIDALMKTYAPSIYFHPEEPHLPSSVRWFFGNGALLYKKVDGGAVPAVSLDPEGSELPQGGSNDGAFWLDLPADAAGREKIKRGDLQGAEAYVHVKPMLGGTFTDLAVWVFYPFNGPATAKVKFLDIPFRRLGEHVGDWEHVTLRVSNFTGELWRVFFAAHSSGVWVDASRLEFERGNKPVAYACLKGHAAYPKPGLVLQGDGKLGVGLRDDTARGGRRMDTGERYRVVSAEHLRSVAEPPWLNYLREWGPTVGYEAVRELEKLEKLLPCKLREEVEKVISSLPKQVLGEEGPTGPKEKRNWAGDEVSK